MFQRGATTLFLALGLGSLEACHRCVIPSQGCLLTERADRELPCPNYINGGDRNDATIVQSKSFAEGNRYTICCGWRMRGRCIHYFCPHGESADRCREEP